MNDENIPAQNNSNIKATQIMKNIFKGKRLALLILIPIVLIIVCTLIFIKPLNSRENAASKIEKFLENKYNQKFIVKGIGGSYGTSDNTTLKAMVYPSGNPEVEFEATIKKDLTTIQDYYVGKLIEKKTVDELTSKLKNDIKNDFLVGSWNDAVESQYINEIGNTTFTPKDYYNNNPGFRPVTVVIVNKEISDFQLKQSTAKEIEKEFRMVTGRDYLKQEGALRIYFASQTEFGNFKNTINNYRDTVMLFDVDQPEKEVKYIYSS